MKVNKLPQEQFLKLHDLTNQAMLAEEEQLTFLTQKAPGLTFYKKHGVGNMKLIPLSLQNFELVDLITEITKQPKEDIVTIHFCEYFPGGETTDHKDSNSSQTILFLLQSADKGGKLRVDGNIVNLDNNGDWVSYNGGEKFHGVTKVEEGYRKVLVVWYGNSRAKKVLF